MAVKVQSATNLPASPDDNRHHRERQYVIAMSIRMVCFAAVFLVPGAWKIIPAVGVVVLPYIAVVLANVGSPHASDRVPVSTTERIKALTPGAPDES